MFPFQIIKREMAKCGKMFITKKIGVFPPQFYMIYTIYSLARKIFYSVFTSLSSWQPAPQLELLHVVVIKIIKIPDKTAH